MLDHLSEGRFEFGMGRGSSTTEQKGFGISDPDLTKRDVRRGGRRVRQDVAHGRVRRATTGSSSRCRRATCCRSRTRKPHPPMWVAAGNPVDVREGRAHGPRRVVLHDRRRRDGQAARRALQERDRERASRSATTSTTTSWSPRSCSASRTATACGSSPPTSVMGYHRSLLLRYLDTFPRPAGVPEWPELLPDPTPEQIDAAIAAGDVAVRHARRSRARDRRSTPTPASTKSCSACCHRRWSASSPPKRSRRSASTYSRSSTRIPRTEPPGRAAASV